MEYDLIRLFEHAQCCLFEFIPSAIAVLSTTEGTRCTIQVQWRRSAGEPDNEAELTLRWDWNVLRARLPEIDSQVRNRREWNDDRARQIEETAIVVAVAVMAIIEPETLFTRRSGTGTSHDYYLNSRLDEMIEIAGRWNDGLDGLFVKKRRQSDLNPAVRKRWVSVTIVQTKRNRTEGLHS
jgi:hypothetical protein